MAANETFDAAVIGAGMVGSALAWGLARAGLATALLDEGDDAFRAARGNFGLVWVQSKGLGLPAYQEWTRTSVDLWPGLSAELAETTGISPDYRRTGGLTPCLSEQELVERRGFVERMRAQDTGGRYACEVLDAAACRALLPALGPAVAGGSYSPHDGQANPLRLLRALQAGLRARGGRHFPGRPAMRIGREGAGFRIETPAGAIAAARVAIAAGLDIPRLAAMVGLGVPIRPERGQILVTERLAPLLPVALLSIRQTAEGTVMIGNSQEGVGFDTATTIPTAARMAARAVRTIPALAGARVVRQWAALRVLAADPFPVYEQSAEAPGAFVVTCHSGVTLAAAHARMLAPRLAAGALGADLAPFSLGRFAARRAA